MILPGIIGRGHNAVILVILVILGSALLGIIVALTLWHYRSAHASCCLTDNPCLLRAVHLDFSTLAAYAMIAA